MIVGVYRVVLSLPWNDSLKGKRAVVKSLLERARSRFNVAAAEVDSLDQHRKATLGFSLVSNDAKHVRQVLDKLGHFIVSEGEAAVVDQQMDVFEHDFEDYGQVLSADRVSDLGRDDDDDEG